ncbi:uncharacterized protein PV09_02371 [Verruconis gallopava]|uniref:Major facilitator superfamily (MFS) profile domain-containing protein n=1 Tax=Verruconis gallopava TaxID=253628 RepID=A0A0D2AJB9_9PEZI|nr:uncharacterized protein PV09_02371 [Verruconis gallopava]KIW06665.1 hypothetical protein PV09_02371 [Verruconis gallopava]
MSESKSAPKDLESGARTGKLSHWRILIDQSITTPEIESHVYPGSGTVEDPYRIDWLPNDPRNPMQFPTWYKWMITLSMAGAVLAVSLCSSAFSSGFTSLLRDFGTSQEVATLSLSLFVLGFAIGPLFWAPMSELYGRQILFIFTFGIFTFFNAGVCGSQNMQTVIILRFFAGSFGSSPLTNAGGVIADMFPARQRGVATAIFAAAPFLGPAVGPVVGGFLAESAGWRWLAGLLAAFSGLVWFIGIALAPETYGPVLLRRRAARLSKITGKVYLSKTDAQQGTISAGEAFKTALSRPWFLLFREPIVFFLSLYMAIIYGTLYMLFSAYPIVYELSRGWSGGIAGLAFLGVLIGMLLAVAYTLWPENPRYQRVVEKHGGIAPPEARLPSTMLGGACLPIGLFWFSWTNSPSLPWAASMAAGIPFGFGMVLVFLGVMNYLIDAYTIFAASVLAANSVIRSLFGAAFPLFTTYMYQNLGIHWASSIPAFLALACVPFPFLFYYYGEKIRMKSKYAAEADAFMKRIIAQRRAEAEAAARGDSETEADAEKELDKEELKAEEEEEERIVAEAEAGAVDYDGARFERIKTAQDTERVAQLSYEASPFDIDRVNTRESFKSRRNSQSSRRGGR